MKVHFIGIGETDIHHLAIALKNMGYHVSGSDDGLLETSKSSLSEMGLWPENLGWFPEKIDATFEVIIIGSQVEADHPELLKAQELGLKIYSYPEYLYEHSKHKTRVVIAGSQGKTTIAAMILHVMDYHQKEVDYMVSHPLKGFENQIKLTDTNDFIVLEGAENLSSIIDPRPQFQVYRPNIALLSGITIDQTNGQTPDEAEVELFKGFVDSIVKGGSITYNEEDAAVKNIVEASENTIRKLPYHTAAHTIEQGETLLETPEGPLPIEISGNRNLNNLSGAKWICQHMGVDEDDFYEAIDTFKVTN